MTRARFLIPAVFALAMLPAVHPAAAAETPAEQVDAYVLVIKAEQAEKNGELNLAADYYREAVELYRNVQKNYPDWRPDLVRYRIVDSMNHLKRLEEQTRVLAVERADPVKPAASSTSEAVAALREREAALRNENAQLKERISALEQAVAQRTGEPSREDTETIRQLRAENRQQQALVSGLEEEIDRLRVELAAARKKSGSGHADADRLKALEAQRAELEKAGSRLEEENRRLADQVKELQEAHRNLQEAAGREADALRRQLDEAVEKAGGTLRARIAELEAALARAAESADEPVGSAREEIYREALSRAEQEVAGLMSKYDNVVEQLESTRNQLASVSGGGDSELERVRGERDRLAEQVEALKETIDMNYAEMEKIRDYKREIKDLKKAGDRLGKELEKVREEMAENDLSREYAEAVSVNRQLTADLKETGKRLEKTESYVKELEDQLKRLEL